MINTSVQNCRLYRMLWRSMKDCKTRYDFIHSRGISVVVPFEIHRAGNGSEAVRELIDATGEF